MRRRTCAYGALVGLAVFALVEGARADPPTESSVAPGWGEGRLLQRFGIDAARRLVQGGDANTPDGVRGSALRGIDRAVALGTEDGVSTLVQMLQDPRSIARSDAVVLLAVTRALAPFAHERTVSHVLIEVVLNVSSGEGRADTLELSAASSDRYRRGRLELARETAALALARTEDPQIVLALVAAARKVGGSQQAATRALVAFPPKTLAIPPIATPEGILLAVSLDDVRAKDSVLEAVHAADRTTRLAALQGVGALGERRGIPALVAAASETDPRARETATRSLVDLGAGEASHAVRKLIEDDETAAAGVALASRVAGDEVVGALAARVRVSSDLSLRRGAILALGRHDEPGALTVLAELLHDPILEGDAAQGIARSSAGGAWDVIARALGDARQRRLGARMAALRGRVVGEVPHEVKHALRELSRSASAADRGAGIAALVLLGDISPADGLGDPDAGVRRAVANVAEPTDPTHTRALRARRPLEKDPVVRLLLARALAEPGDNDWTTEELEEHVRAGDIAAPLSALALARTADDPDREHTFGELHAVDPLVRSHAARGLSESTRPWAIALLAPRYTLEADADVRRTLVTAIAQRTGDAQTSMRAHVLESAAFFDPDEGIRTIALRARMGLAPPEPPRERDLVWLRTMSDQGAAPSPPPSGVLVRADGLAVPVVFDDDGYCLVPAPRGAARLVLAPRLHSYEASSHGE